MKAAIYARYSSENQSEKSIEDQVRVCKEFCSKNGMFVDERHIYVDEAVSGSLVARPGLKAMEAAAEHKEIACVVVDDLSRLSRSNHQMLTMVLKFKYLEVKIVSVSDGLVTDDENAKLGIHLRGLMNELYLDDLRKKTIRGQEGQKIRGFSVGERVYGYVTKPVGELRIDKKGRAKYDGMKHVIEPEEAEIVRRIYREFTDGKSIQKIIRNLNQDKVPTKKNLRGGWNVSTVSRILKNEKYVGEWTWRRTKKVRDPMTGKSKQVPRPKSEYLTNMRKELSIIDDATWQKAQERWKNLEGTWAITARSKTKCAYKSYVHNSPNHLLSGLMKCSICEGPIVIISGKGSGYYGCHNAKRKTCTNNLLVPLKRIEKVLLEDLRDRIMTPENVEYALKKVEKKAAESLNEVPEDIRKKKARFEKLQVQINHYLAFIREGNLSKVVGEALKESEGEAEALKMDLEALEYQKNNQFAAPPREWIVSRLGRLHELLKKKTSAAAMALKELLGTVKLEPVLTKDADPFYGLKDSLGDCFGPASPALAMTGEGDTLQDGGCIGPENPEDIPHRCPEDFPAGVGRVRQEFKPYYVAHTKVQTLALLDEGSEGSISSQMRARLSPIRNSAELVSFFPINCCEFKPLPLYQQIAPNVKQLRLLGMTYEAIADSLGVSTFCVRRAAQLMMTK